MIVTSSLTLTRWARVRGHDRASPDCVARWDPGSTGVMKTAQENPRERLASEIKVGFPTEFVMIALADSADENGFSRRIMRG